MPLLETLITGVGTSVAGAIVRMWLKDEPIAAAAGGTVVSILGKKIPDIRHRNATARQIDEIGEQAAESILAMLEKEADVVVNTRLEVIANAAGETILNSPIDAKLLAERNLEPELLADYFLDRTGVEGGNPGLAGTEDGSSGFSAFEKQVYRRILEHAAQLIVDISSQFPLFSERILGEILRRETNLSEKAERIIEGLDRLLAAQTGENLGDERFETAYRSSCIRRLDQLELFGVDLQETNKRYKLSVAYVTLELESENHQDSKGETDREEERTSMPVDQALRSTSRLLIRGPAGSGKTTLLQWAAVHAAGREFQGALTSFNDLVPFLLKLRDYSDEPLPSPEDFPRAISTALAGKPENWAHRRLQSGTAIVMIDGVDEAAEKRREDVRKWLRDLTELYPAARFVVTSRPHAAKEGWLDEEGFVDASLQQMSRTDIYEFVDHWHQAVSEGLGDPDKQAELKPLANTLKGRLRQDGSLFKLASSPLLCAILCALHRDRQQDLPKDRVDLYRACIEMFFRRDRERSVDMGDYVKLTDRQKHRLLQNFAWWLIKNGKSSASPAETENHFDSKLSRLTDRPKDSSGLNVSRLLIERVGILRQLSASKIDFPHRTFQEFLAAHEAVADNDLGLLVKHAHEDQWREVAVLAGGLIENENSAEGFLSDLLKRGDSSTNDRAALYIVAAAALEAVTVLPLNTSLKQEIANRLQQIVPPNNISEAKELAAGGDLVVPHLSRVAEWTVKQTAAAIRTLALIGSETATELIATYVDDKRLGVIKELVKAISTLQDDLAKRISPILLRGHLNETSINLQGTQISDVSALASCSALKTLNLMYTEVSDVSALASCSDLESLNLRGTKVGDVSALASCSDLKTLNLMNTEVSDVSALASCSALKWLDLDGTKVTDVSALASCSDLKWLDLLNTKVSDVSAFAPLKRKGLRIARNV